MCQPSKRVTGNMDHSSNIEIFESNILQFQYIRCKNPTEPKLHSAMLSSINVIFHPNNRNICLQNPFAMSSNVPNFYNNQNVLITGGTGYLGKLIIGKLLRTTNVNNIYVIIRHKKGISSDQRLQQLFDEMVSWVYVKNIHDK